MRPQDGSSVRHAIPCKRNERPLSPSQVFAKAKERREAILRAKRVKHGIPTDWDLLLEEDRDNPHIHTEVADSVKALAEARHGGIENELKAAKELRILLMNGLSCKPTCQLGLFPLHGLQ